MQPNQNKQTPVKKDEYKTQEMFNRLDERVLEENLDDMDEDDIRDLESLDPERPEFKSELDFDGYKNIEEYDNGAFESIVDGKPDIPKPLNFKDRREEEEIPEESPVDVQQNRVTETSSKNRPVDNT